MVKKERSREEANRQKSKLPDLFTNTERPKWSKPTTKCVFLVSIEFVMAWKAFIRDMSSGKVGVEDAPAVNNSILVCEHKGLLHVPQFNWENEPDNEVVMVKEDEWKALKELYVWDEEVRVDRYNTANGPVLVATPSPCEICVKNKVEAEQESRLNYKNQKVYVTFLTQDEELPDPDTEEMAVSSMLGKLWEGGNHLRFCETGFRCFT